MNKVKINITEEFSERTIDGVVGSASFEIDDIPDDLKLPSKAWLAKKWRKWKAYERVWDEVCQAHENYDRDVVFNKLKNLTDPIDFIVFLLEFHSASTNTAKLGGEAKNASSKPLIERARRLFSEKKVEYELKGKRYSQKQFAESHRKKLFEQYEDRMQEIREGQTMLDQINDEIKLGELSASELKLKREEKHEIEEAIRIKPILPAVKIIEGWLKGL